MIQKARPSVNPAASRLSTVLISANDASFQLCGYFDGVHGRCANGWIIDMTSPSSTLTIEVFDGSKSLGTTRAGLFRADLDAVGIADGHHAFRFDLPDEIFDGAEHEIWVRL